MYNLCMSEKEPSPENNVASREQVVEALRVIAARGYGDPADLPPDDPEVQAASAMQAA
jgi:hypothetical protein